MAERRRFITGGTVSPESPLYLERPADAELLKLCLAGEFCYVLTSRQMGKSSLMARTAVRLREQGVIPVIIDLTTIGAHNVMPDQWYLGLLVEVEQACQPATDLFSWWEEHGNLPTAQRFSRYFSEVLVKEVSRRIVIFVDEIDSTLGLGFTDDFFAAIRAFHNARAAQPELERLSFVLLGVATPGELIDDQARTPFNIGRRVELNDFAAEEARPLVVALGLSAEAVEPTLARVLHWTGGQPYLTQRLCALLEERGAGAEAVDRLVVDDLLGDQVARDPHFQFVANYVTGVPPEQKAEIFETYGRVLKGGRVECRDASVAQNRLRLSGLVRRQGDFLVTRNELYRRLFGDSWVRKHRPTFWTTANKRLAAGLAVALVVAGLLGYLWQKAENEKKRADAALGRLAGEKQRADEAAKRAIVERDRADEAAKRAIVERDRADEAAKRANAESARAQAATDSAKKSLIETIAGKLVMQSRAILDRQQHGPPDVALLLSAAGFRLQPDNDAYGGLRYAINASAGQKRIVSFPEPVIAVSPDGLTVVTVEGKTVRIWDAASGKPRGALLEGHTGWVNSVAFSPDGRRVVYGGLVNTVRIWDAAKRRGAPLEGHTGWVSSLAFSPDGRSVVSGSEDKTVRIWDAASGKPRGAPLEGHTDSVSSVAFSPDGRSVVSGSRDNTVRIWDAASGKPRGVPFEGHTGGVNSVAFSPDGRSVVSGSGDKTVRIWDAASGKPRGAPLEGHTASVLSVAFSPDGRSVVSGSSDNTVRIWDAPAVWIDRICEKLVRNLSHKEWKQYVGDIPYVKQCPGLPVPAD